MLGAIAPCIAIIRLVRAWKAPEAGTRTLEISTFYNKEGDSVESGIRMMRRVTKD